ncbi:hypothetical protein SAMN02927923_04329 [Microvirga guangxiensis]|uniref:Uncharacterized protein n=1 Tax=Microvirga guangxiensis TaxID=549386 RepID=A0A1G5LHE7_9HYPH|nr:hypothetical protein SAMN02927923_04329 [Microvirga guangxiensis]
MQAAGSGEAEARDLTDDCSQALFPKAFLDDSEDIALAEGLSVNDTVRVKASRSEARCEQVAPVKTPQDRTFETCGDAGGKEGGASGELRRSTIVDELVKRTALQAAVRQVTVEAWHAERQDPSVTAAAFEASDPSPQIGKPVLLPGLHGPVPVQVRVDDVPIMFSFSGESIDHTRL